VGTECLDRQQNFCHRRSQYSLVTACPFPAALHNKGGERGSSNGRSNNAAERLWRWIGGGRRPAAWSVPPPPPAADRRQRRWRHPPGAAAAIGRQPLGGPPHPRHRPRASPPSRRAAAMAPAFVPAAALPARWRPPAAAARVAMAAAPPPGHAPAPGSPPSPSPTSVPARPTALTRRAVLALVALLPLAAAAAAAVLPAVAAHGPTPDSAAGPSGGGAFEWRVNVGGAPAAAAAAEGEPDVLVFGRILDGWDVVKAVEGVAGGKAIGDSRAKAGKSLGGGGRLSRLCSPSSTSRGPLNRAYTNRPDAVGVSEQSPSSHTHDRPINCQERTNCGRVRPVNHLHPLPPSREKSTPDDSTARTLPGQANSLRVLVSGQAARQCSSSRHSLR